MDNTLSTHTTYPLMQRAVLISIILGSMLVPLNSTMIAIALPDIMDAFAVDVRTVNWLVTAYLVTMAALQLVSGKLGDQYGRRRFVLGGLIYFGISSLLAALSPSLLVLLFARVQQAMAGSILITNGIPLAFETAPENHRGRNLGLVSAVLGLAAAAGPPLGGLLVGIAGWRAIFWVNLPVVIAALLSGWLSISETQPHQRQSLFDWHEILRLFRSQTFAYANGAILFSNFAMYVILLAVPILMSTQSGWASFQTGLLLAAMSVTIAVFTPVGGRLADRFGRRTPSIAGIVLLAAGGLLLAIFGGKIHIPLLLACLWLIGMGLGLSSVGLQTSVLESVELQQAGLVTGISTTSRYLGSILGSNILAQVLGPAPIEGSHFRIVFLMVAVSACIALLMSYGIDHGLERFHDHQIPGNKRNRTFLA